MKIDLYPAHWKLWPLYERTYQARWFYLGPIVVYVRVDE